MSSTTHKYIKKHKPAATHVTGGFAPFLTVAELGILFWVCESKKFGRTKIIWYIYEKLFVVMSS
jgi:hypothetical protein